MACKTGAIGNLGCVGGSDNDAMKLGAWNIRVAWGWKIKNNSTLANITINNKKPTEASTTHRCRNKSGWGTFAGQFGQISSNPEVGSVALPLSGTSVMWENGWSFKRFAPAKKCISPPELIWVAPAEVEGFMNRSWVCFSDGNEKLGSHWGLSSELGKDSKGGGELTLWSLPWSFWRKRASSSSYLNLSVICPKKWRSTTYLFYSPASHNDSWAPQQPRGWFQLSLRWAWPMG